MTGSLHRSLRGRRHVLKSKSRLLLYSAASLAAAYLSGPRAFGAAGGTWNQAQSNTYDFGTSGNWINLNVPSGTGSLADFSQFNFLGDETINFGTATTLGSMTFGDLDDSSDANFDFTGSAPSRSRLATGQPTINVLWDFISVFGKYIRFDNSIGGAAGLVKTGAGILWLNGANTFSGAAVVTGGTLRASNAANFGSGTVLLNGGTLDLRNDTSTNFGVNVALSANSSINVDSIPGSGATGQTQTIGALNFGAAGATRTLTITNVNPNTTNPPTLDNNNYGFASGMVTLNDNAVFTSNVGGAITLGGVTSNAATPATLSIGGSSGFAGNITIAGAMSQTAGPLAITFTNNRTLILAGAMTYTGGTNVTGGGTVQVASGFTLPTNGPVTVSNGTLDLNSTSATIGTLTMGGGNGTLLTESGTVTLGGSVVYNVYAGAPPTSRETRISALHRKP